MNAPVDFNLLKTRQQTAWASGDYAVIGTTLQLVGELLAEACDLRWDEQVLDVAAGNGNATLAAARRGARVTSTDYVQGLLDQGAARARAEGLSVDFQVADAEALPFGDSAANLKVTPRVFPFRYRSAAHFVDVFRQWYGPVHKAFAALPADKAQVLEQELVALLEEMNTAGPDSLVVQSAYLEVVVTRR